MIATSTSCEILLDALITARTISITTSGEIVISNMSYIDGDGAHQFADVKFQYGNDVLQLPVVFAQGTHIIQLVDETFTGIGLSLEGSNLDKVTSIDFPFTDSSDDELNDEAYKRSTADTLGASMRAAADTQLQNNITAEVQRAQQAESTLQTNITAETNARTAAGTSEATARAAADAQLQPKLTFDTIPTAGSANPVTSDGIHIALQGAGGASVPAAMSLSPDWPPTTPNAMDDEFTASSLNGKWTIINQGAKVLTFEKSVVKIEGLCAGTAENLILFVQPMPIDATWKFGAKLFGCVSANNVGAVGLLVRNSTTGRFVILRCIPQGNAINIDRTAYLSPTAVSADSFLFARTTETIYMTMEKSGTNIIFKGSTQGYGIPSIWLTEALATFLATADQVGLAISVYGSNANYMSCGCDWFRRVV
jgi:hypothetical protein